MGNQKESAFDFSKLDEQLRKAANNKVSNLVDQKIKQTSQSEQVCKES